MQVNKVVMFTPMEECVACRTTKIRFDKLGISYEVVESDDSTVDELRREGFCQFPVVKIDCGDGAGWSWSGYRHDDINRLAQLFLGG